MGSYVGLLVLRFLPLELFSLPKRNTSIGITLVGVSSKLVLIGCMIFLSQYLDIKRMPKSRVSNLV